VKETKDIIIEGLRCNYMALKAKAVPLHAMKALGGEEV
jgi:hypothetical protein